MPDAPSLGPAALYERDHPPVRNVNVEHEARMSVGQRVADTVAALVGSWPFIIVQSTVLAAWLALNVYLAVAEVRHPGFLRAWDPYPFILLNLLLSFQAAYTGPVVMMSQNRQAEKDRLAAEHDYEINKRAEEEIEVIMDHLAHQDRLILDAIERLETIRVAPPLREVVQQITALMERMDENDRRIMALVERIERAPGG